MPMKLHQLRLKWIFDGLDTIIKAEKTFNNSDGETSTKSYDIKYFRIEIPRIFIDQIKADYGIDLTE